MKILISGSSGFIGTVLVTALKTAGHDLIRLVRSETGLSENRSLWNPERGAIDRDRLERLDAIISLGGVNIVSGRWTNRLKEQIVRSRLESTRLLAETITSLKEKPKVWLSASAVGIYGPDRTETVDEASVPADDFLSKLCVQWEAACQPARDSSVRVINLRFGMVLSPSGGALKKMLPLFRAGLGGRLGDGKQMMNWITLEDSVSAIFHLLESDTTQGPVNLITPNPVTNREFTKTLARAVHRPALLPVPAFVLKTMLGEMSHSLLLSRTSATPKNLLSSGFGWAHPELAPALAHLFDQQ